MIDDAKFRRVPTVFVRYEDLVNDPRPELETLMKMIIGVNSLEGTNGDRRIDQVIAKGKDATKTYKLKDNTGKFNANAHLYSEQQK